MAWRGWSPRFLDLRNKNRNTARINTSNCIAKCRFPLIPAHSRVPRRVKTTAKVRMRSVSEDIAMSLLVFLVDVEDGAVFVEGYVEGFGFFDEDVGELIFLG
jgi:hypothetical protein